MSFKNLLTAFCPFFCVLVALVATNARANPASSLNFICGQNKVHLSVENTIAATISTEKGVWVEVPGETLYDDAAVVLLNIESFKVAVMRVDDNQRNTTLIMFKDKLAFDMDKPTYQSPCILRK